MMTCSRHIFFAHIILAKPHTTTMSSVPTAKKAVLLLQGTWKGRGHVLKAHAHWMARESLSVQDEQLRE